MALAGGLTTRDGTFATKLKRERWTADSVPTFVGFERVNCGVVYRNRPLVDDVPARANHRMAVLQSAPLAQQPAQPQRQIQAWICREKCLEDFWLFPIPLKAPP